MMRIYNIIGESWRKFVAEVRRNAEQSDLNQIKIDTLANLIKKYGY